MVCREFTPLLGFREAKLELSTPCGEIAWCMQPTSIYAHVLHESTCVRTNYTNIFYLQTN